MKRIFVYLLYLAMFVVFSIIIIQMIFSGNFLLVIGGISSSVILLVIYGSLILREIMYWASRKPESDGWEDDLTNQQ